MKKLARHFFRQNEGIGVMVRTGQVGVWVAAAAWVLAAGSMLAAWVRWVVAGRTPTSPR